MPSRLPRRLLARAAIGVALCAAAPAGAQGPGGPDIADFALLWARGGFASTIVCRFGENARRGLRRVIIEAGPRSAEQRVDRVKFVDLGARGADRCADELGAEEPNVVGTLLVTYKPKRPRSDTPQRDFQKELERGPIEYEIVRGRLRVGPAAEDAAKLPEIEFGGGTFSLATVRPGSDDLRRIGDLPGTRALRLEARAKDGTRLSFPLVELERR